LGEIQKKIFQSSTTYIAGFGHTRKKNSALAEMADSGVARAENK